MKTMDHIVKAPLDASCLSGILNPYGEQVSAIIAEHGCTFSSKADAEWGAVDGLNEQSWASIMDDLNNKRKICDRIAREPRVRAFAEHQTGHKLKPFFINKVRINNPSLSKSRYTWHQDVATWPGMIEQYPTMKTAKIITFWLCLSISNEGNGLALLPTEMETIDHMFVDNQGYFNADVAGVDQDNEIKIFGPSYTAAIFGQNVLHKSLSGSDTARLSFDLRYYHV